MFRYEVGLNDGSSQGCFVLLRRTLRANLGGAPSLTRVDGEEKCSNAYDCQDEEHVRAKCVVGSRTVFWAAF